MYRPLAVVLAICATLFILTGCAPKKSLAGDWSGAVSVPNPMTGANVTINLVVHVLQDDSGNYTATLDSIEQKASGIKFDSFTFKDSDVNMSLNVGATHATFAGKTNTDLTKITGTWSQMGLTIPLELNKQAEKTGSASGNDGKK